MGDLTLSAVLLFGLLGLGALVAALAVRMVSRSH